MTNVSTNSVSLAGTFIIATVIQIVAVMLSVLEYCTGNCKFQVSRYVIEPRFLILEHCAGCTIQELLGLYEHVFDSNYNKKTEMRDRVERAKDKSHALTRHEFEVFQEKLLDVIAESNKGKLQSRKKSLVPHRSWKGKRKNSQASGSSRDVAKDACDDVIQIDMKTREDINTKPEEGTSLFFHLVLAEKDFSTFCVYTRGLPWQCLSPFSYHKSFSCAHSQTTLLIVPVSLCVFVDFSISPS